MKFWKQHKKRRGVYLIPEYVTLLQGDVHAGILLCQLIYWFQPSGHGHSKLTIERDGKQWLAKSREELMKECALTLNKYRAAIARLEQLGLVRREFHRFNGERVSHLHLDVPRLEQWSSGWNSLTGLSEINSLGQVEFTHPLTDAETTAETTAEKELATSVATAFPHLVVQEQASGEQKLGEVIQMPTAKEILKNMQAKKEDKQPKGTLQFAARWKSTIANVYEEGFVKALTGQEIGQLKGFITACGGDEKACTIMDFAIHHWAEFAFRVKSVYGLATAPERPVVGFLLKYHDVAWQLVAKSTKAKAALPEETVAPKPVVTQVQDPDDTVTKEAVQAALASLKEGS